MICPLCESNTPSFPKSHIIPKWSYDEQYDETGPRKLNLLELRNQTKQTVQTGFYARIVCESCEINFGQYDSYAALILAEKSPHSPEQTAIKKEVKVLRDKSGVFRENYEYWTGINFKKFQNFFLSIALKQHFYLLNKKKDYLFVDKHFQKIRSLYLGENIDDEIYPIFLSRLNANKMEDSVITLPVVGSYSGHTVIMMQLARFIATIIVSSHQKPDTLMKMRLQANGSVFVIQGSFTNTALFKTAIPALTEIFKKNPPIPRAHK